MTLIRPSMVLLILVVSPFPNPCGDPSASSDPHFVFTLALRGALAARSRLSWEKVVRFKYDCDQLSPLNTLWLRAFSCKPGLEEKLLEELRRTVFLAVPELQRCLLPVPQGKLSSLLAGSFSPLPCKDQSLLQGVRVVSRSDARERVQLANFSSHLAL
jgi:hypothetical protein